MANPKEKFYWGQLRAALTAGAWGSSTPAKAFNGSPVSWSELFRKFLKYNPGYKEVEEVSNRTQHLSLLIAGDSIDDALDGDGSLHRGALDLGSECAISEGHMEEAAQIYEALKNVEAGSVPSDVRPLDLVVRAGARRSCCTDSRIERRLGCNRYTFFYNRL
jgi:hypothetical protein